MPTKILFAINDQGSNYKTRDRKKDINTYKTAGQPSFIRMKNHHKKNSNSPQTLNIAPKTTLMLKKLLMNG